jgi:hypothetical protein
MNEEDTAAGFARLGVADSIALVISETRARLQAVELRLQQTPDLAGQQGYYATSEGVFVRARDCGQLQAMERTQAVVAALRTRLQDLQTELEAV